jgi:hypothetical protein
VLHAKALPKRNKVLSGFIRYCGQDKSAGFAEQIRFFIYLAKSHPDQLWISQLPFTNNLHQAGDMWLQW